MKLLMRGSEDGFTAEQFHRLCDRKGPTLTVVRSEPGMVGKDYICGGYSSVSWQCPPFPTDVPDPKAFLFSLNHQSIHTVE